MTLPHVVLSAAGLAFIGFGLAFTFAPVPMSGLVEISLPTPTARVDFGATYGGFEIGFGVFLLACTRRAAWVEQGLWAATAALAGFASIRLLGLLLAPAARGGVMFMALAMEIGGVIMCGLALVRVRRRQPA